MNLSNLSCCPAIIDIHLLPFNELLRSQTQFENKNKFEKELLLDLDMKLSSTTRAKKRKHGAVRLLNCFTREN